MKKTFIHIFYPLIICFCIFTTTNVSNSSPNNGPTSQDLPVWWDNPEIAWKNSGFKDEDIADYFVSKIVIDGDGEMEAIHKARLDIAKKFVHVYDVYERKKEMKSKNKILDVVDYVKKHTYIGTNIFLFDCIPEKIIVYHSKKTGKHYSLWTIKKERVLNAIDLSIKRGWWGGPEKVPEKYYIRARGAGRPANGITNPLLQRIDACETARAVATTNLLREIEGATYEAIRPVGKDGKTDVYEIVEKIKGKIRAGVIPNSEKWENGICTLEVGISLKDYQDQIKVFSNVSDQSTYQTARRAGTKKLKETK